MVKHTQTICQLLPMNCLSAQTIKSLKVKLCLNFYSILPENQSIAIIVILLHWPINIVFSKCFVKSYLYQCSLN